MAVRILGPVEVDGIPVSGREAAVLAALAVRTGHAVSVDELIDAVWGDDPPMTAPKSLQNAISRLRRDTGVDIETVERGYRLRADVDVAQVEALRRAGDPEAALALWRGEPTALPAGQRARVDELRAALEEEVVEELLGRGERADAVAILERAVVEAPYRERRWVLLTRALAGDGRQADALRAVQRARTILRDELGLEPGAELLAAERDVLTPAPTRCRRPPPVPARSFIGREAEVEAVRAGLASSRVVTLVGPGGVGKTRLALASMGADATFVDFAPMARSEEIWVAVAGAAGILVPSGRDVGDAVVAALTDGVVVLDNCEHVLDAAAEVATRLRASVLATSREPLGLPEESVLAVAPLAEADAVRLYRERAAAAGADTGDDRAVAELCRRLDGLPLAIELAAARALALDASQLLARLDDRFALLDERARRGDPRHRALRAIVDWSHDLLEADERELFARLSVFRAPFRLEDAERVTGDERVPNVAAALARLVRASMVAVESRGGVRSYRLLETFRDYAAARLEAPARWRERHAEWIDALATAAGPELEGPDQVAWFTRVGDAFDDIQEALAWCDENRPSTGLRIATNLFHFWMGRARRSEGLRWLERFATTATDVSPLDRCRALFAAGMIAMMIDLGLCDELGATAQRIADDRDARAIADVVSALGPIFRGDLAAATPLVERSRPVLEEEQHAGTMPQIWNGRAFVAMLTGRHDEARRLIRSTMDVLAARGERHLFGAFMGFEADAAFAAGDDDARAVASEALAIAEEIQCPSCLASALSAVALHDGDVDRTRRAVELQAGIGEMSGLVYGIHQLAGALAPSEPERAARLLGGVTALRERTGHLAGLPGRGAFAVPRLDEARDSLGASRWDELVAEGRGLADDELVELATC